jgi:hypothetical protein
MIREITKADYPSLQDFLILCGFCAAWLYTIA